MKKSNWHKQDFSCPKCQCAVTIQEIAFSASGEILVVGFCFKCGDLVSCVYLWEEIIIQCLNLDNETPVFIHQGNDLIN